MNPREKYWKYSLIAIILILGLVVFNELTPLLGGILGASTIYILLRKQVAMLTEKRMHPSFIALLMLLETVLCFLIPLSLAVWLLVNRLQHINLDPHRFASSFEQLAEVIHAKVGFDLLDKNNIGSVITSLPQIGQSLIGGVSSLAVNVVFMVLILYFMLIEGKKMEAYIYDILPFSEHNKREVLKDVHILVKSNAIGIPLLALIQGFVAMVGYFLFGAPSPILFGFLTCFATIIPLIGTSIIWLPLAAYLFIMDDWVNAAGLAVYSLLILTNVDNLVRFMLQKRIANTHPLITIFGALIGLSLFGFIGVIFGPILLSVFLLCINIFKREYLEEKKED